MSQLRIELFGKFCARCSDQVVEGLEASKVQELLCYILLNRTRPHARETLAGVLWGETSTSQSRKYLRQALWQLQTALERHANIIGDRLLLLEPNWIHLNADCSLWLDVDEFERAFTFVQGIGGAQLDCDQAERLRQAALLYKGDLLEGWYQDWCWFERERFQNMYLTLLDKLTAYCEAHNDYEAGLDYGTRILQFDRARERTHQQLIRLYMLSGDRAAALRQFERCAAALQAELGVEPSKYTLALHAQIQSDSLDLTALPSGTLEPDLVKRLENVWKVLADMQAYLRKETLEIEQLLNGHRADS
jgi:DNA-binding SARP family transcriptional activator